MKLNQKLFHIYLSKFFRVSLGACIISCSSGMLRGDVKEYNTDLLAVAESAARSQSILDVNLYKSAVVESFMRASQDQEAKIIIASIPFPSNEGVKKLSLSDASLENKFLYAQPWYQRVMNSNGHGFYVEETISGNLDSPVIVVMFNRAQSLWDKRYPTLPLSGSTWMMAIKPIKMEGVSSSHKIFYEPYSSSIFCAIPVVWPSDADYSPPFAGEFDSEDIRALKEMSATFNTWKDKK